MIGHGIGTHSPNEHDKQAREIQNKICRGKLRNRVKHKKIHWEEERGEGRYLEERWNEDILWNDKAVHQADLHKSKHVLVDIKNIFYDTRTLY